MPAKTITLSQKDQDLLRTALGCALNWVIMHTCEEELADRIKELKERLV